MSLCAFILFRDVPSMCLRAKRRPEDTRGRPSRGTAPKRKTSAAAQRTGGHREVATRKATGDTATTEERATQRARESSMWRTGAVFLHLYAASYGRWLLSKAPTAQPSRVTCLLQGFGLSLLF